MGGSNPRRAAGYESQELARGFTTEPAGLLTSDTRRVIILSTFSCTSRARLFLTPRRRPLLVFINFTFIERNRERRVNAISI